MMRLSRIGSPLAAFSLLTSAATASAECAWVLWVQVSEEPWLPLNTAPDYATCKHLQAESVKHTLGAPRMARLPARHRPHRCWDAPSRLRPPVDAVRRARLAGDVLHDRHGAFADKRDGHRVGADAVARDAAGGVGGVAED